VLQSPSNEVDATFSPDARWIAYASGQSGRFEVFVTAADGSPGTWQISQGGGRFPRWRRDGKEILYVGPQGTNTIFAASIELAGTTVTLGPGKRLFSLQFRGGGYGVSADGRSFLMNVIGARQVPDPVTIVVNWTAGLGK
jgi:hypothetical protein